MAEENVSYVSNSNKNKMKSANEEVKPEADVAHEPRVAKATTGKVVVRKKSNMSKFRDSMISEEAGNIKNYVVMDVLIPAFKKAISDIVKNGIEMLLYGSTGDPDKRRQSSGVSYRDYYDKDRNRSGRYDNRSRIGYDMDEAVVATRAEAENVLNTLDDALDRYGMVSVADLYDCLGITPKYTDCKYGWTNLRNAGIERVRDGYLIHLPRPVPIG